VGVSTGRLDTYKTVLYPSNQDIRANIQAFSDTIIITVTLKKKDENTPVIELDRLVLHAAQLILPMIINGILRGIYLRGVISFGKFYQSDTAIIGPAVDEAAEWYTNIEWIGVSAAPTAYFILEKLAEIGQDVAVEGKKFFIKYDIPTKANTTEKGWAVNWPNLFSNFLSPPGGMSAKALILNRFGEKPVSVSAMPKFHNTLKFIDHIMGK
jgi:hypothetical protein